VFWFHAAGAALVCLLTRFVPLLGAAGFGPPGWLYIQPGVGYSCKNVGMTVLDHRGYEIVIAQATNLHNLKGLHEALPTGVFPGSATMLVKFTPEPEGRLVFARELGKDNFPWITDLIADRAGSIYASAVFNRNAQLLERGNLRTFESRGREDGLIGSGDQMEFLSGSTKSVAQRMSIWRASLSTRVATCWW
jgi:hypothetical protein